MHARDERASVPPGRAASGASPWCVGGATVLAMAFAIVVDDAEADVRVSAIWQPERPARAAIDVRGPITGWVALESGRTPLGTLATTHRGARIIVGGVRLIGRVPLDEGSVPASLRPWRVGRPVQTSEARARGESVGVEAALGNVRVAVLCRAAETDASSDIRDASSHVRDASSHVLVGSRHPGKMWELQVRSGGERPDVGIALGRDGLRRGAAVQVSRVDGEARFRVGARARTRDVTCDLVWWASGSGRRVAAWSMRARDWSFRHDVRVAGADAARDSRVAWRVRRHGWSVAAESGHRVPHELPLWLRVTLRPPPPSAPSAWRWECRADAVHRDGRLRLGLRAATWMTRGPTRLRIAVVLADVGTSALSIRLAPGVSRALALGERSRAWHVTLRHRDADVTLGARARDGITDVVIGTRVTWR